MAKLFFEVFPTLKITGEMSALLKEREYKANSKTGNLSY